MSEEERDWGEEGKKLYAIYCRRGYPKGPAYFMAREEIKKRKVEYGYPIEREEVNDLLEAVEAEAKRQDGETSKKANSKLVKTQRKGAKR